MGAIFFGSSKEPLFGFYHPPRSQRARDTGILLCPPAPQEYMRTHWAFRRLADLLCRAGFPVLRFDYFGTGDSAGASDAGNLEIWRANIHTAAQELRDLGSVRKLSAVGFRMGALLAATSGVRFESLALWEPVVLGARYMDELIAVQRRYLEQNPRPAWTLETRPEELLGFPLPRSLEAAIRALDLLSLELPKAARTAIFVSEAAHQFKQLSDSWSARGLATSLYEVPDEAAPAEPQVNAALLSNKALLAISTHFD